MNYLIPGPNLGRLTSVLDTLKQHVAALGYQLDFNLGGRTQIENESGVISEQLTLTVTAVPPSFVPWMIIGAMPCTAMSQHHLRAVPDCGVPEPYVDITPHTNAKPNALPMSVRSVLFPWKYVTCFSG